MPSAVTMLGVVLVTTPMNPTRTPLTRRIVHGLSRGFFLRPCCFSTLADR